MDKLGNFEYPTLRTFKEALHLAQVTLEKFAGVIPMVDASKELGYTVSNSAAISGTIYKHINDICKYGLLTREGIRGGLKGTALAKDALNPFDTKVAASGQARAVRGIELVERAYSAWDGGLPDIAALPARLNELTGADWTDCKNQAANIETLLEETFPIIQLSNQLGGDSNPQITPQSLDRGETTTKTEIQQNFSQPTSTIQTPKQSITIDEFVLGDGIRIYLPKESRKSAWEKAKKVMKVLVEDEDIKTEKS